MSNNIWFVKRYPNIQFYGYDSSTFLVNLGKKRAAHLPNVHFSEVDAGLIPAGEPFDLLLLLGNSFDYGSQASDVEMLNVFHVLKPGEFFVMDVADAEWMQPTMKDRSWEWIDGRDADQLFSGQGCAADTLGSKMLVCRERELNATKDTLACRAIIINLENGMAKDKFYSVRLYRRCELNRLLSHCGFAIHPVDLVQKTKSERDQDLGMMGQRHLILAQKPDFCASHSSLHEADVLFVHPALKLGTVPGKDRGLLAAEHVAAGTVLLASKPYAMAPYIAQPPGDYFICSNYACSKRLDKVAAAGLTSCVCIEDVVWCDGECREQDRQRHDLECAWLRQFKDEITSEHGTYDFIMLWINVRALCQRQVALSQAGLPANNGTAKPEATTTTTTSTEDELRLRGANSWESVDALLADQSFPADTRAHWTRLAETYLDRQPFAAGLAVHELEGLICKEETNSFSLCPGATG